MVIYLFLQKRPCLKSVNHERKILKLEQSEDEWFKNVLRYFWLVGLCVIAFTTINYDMQEGFIER